MGRRKQQFVKLFGYMAMADNGDTLGISQAGGDLAKVERSLPGNKIKDKNGQICTQPMSPDKREKVLAWISQRR